MLVTRETLCSLDTTIFFHRQKQHHIPMISRGSVSVISYLGKNILSHKGKDRVAGIQSQRVGEWRADRKSYREASRCCLMPEQPTFSVHRWYKWDERDQQLVVKCIQKIGQKINKERGLSVMPRIASIDCSSVILVLTSQDLTCWRQVLVAVKRCARVMWCNGRTYGGFCI